MPVLYKNYIRQPRSAQGFPSACLYTPQSAAHVVNVLNLNAFSTVVVQACLVGANEFPAPFVVVVVDLHPRLAFRALFSSLCELYAATIMSHQYFVNLTCTDITPGCPVTDTIYGYYPSLGFNSFFIAFFALFAIVHAALGIVGRTYFFAYVLTLGCISEALGYGGRIMLWQNPFNSTGFELQISCLIFAPSFVAAAIYITLKQLVLTFGEATSLLRPSLYTWIFISCDMVSLTLQAVGGGLAGSAGENASQRDVGTNLMIAGIVFQVVTLLAFTCLVLLYIVHTRSSWHETVPSQARDLVHSRRFQLFCSMLAVATLAVFTRCIYRIPELTGGWGSPLMRDEPSFIVLEGL